MCNLSDPIYQDESKAREHLEALRWPNGPICPHCGVEGNAYKIATTPTQPKNGGKVKPARQGLYKCADCRKQFSVTVGTVFERSKVPLRKWLLATHLLCFSKKVMSSNQLARTLGVTLKTAWFMSHRIREAVKPTETPKMGSGGGFVEAEENLHRHEQGRPRPWPQA